MQRKDEKIRKNFLISKKLAKILAFEAVAQECFERDIIERALQSYFLSKTDSEMIG